MVTDSLPAIPSHERIKADAAHMAAGILRSLTWNERQPVEDYGRCLVHQVAPTTGQTLRFINALRRYAPYVRAAGRLSTDLTALRQLQDEIARRVALGL